jgi:multiple sugar transport system substrate-binding protein
MEPRAAQRVSRRAVLAAAPLLTPLVAACAMGGNQPAAPEAASKAPATIVYWCNVGQSDWEKIQAAATEYGKKSPQHKIEATNDPGAEADYGAKLITAFAGGAAPDAIWTTTRRVIPFQSAGGIADLTSLYARSKIKTDQYYPQAIEEQSVNGKLYGISQGWGVGVLGINRNLFQNAGITLKPDFDKTWTHQDFLDMLKKVAKTNAQGDLETWGVDYSETWPLWWDFGTDFLDKDRKKCIIADTAAGSQALQFWSDLTWTYRVQPKRTGGDRPQGINMWNTGRQGLLGNAGPFVLAQWEPLDFTADIVLRPIGPKPRFHRWYTDCYTLWSGSKVKDAAWEFMAYAGTDGQKDVENAGGRSIPGYKPVAETVFLQRKTLNINKQRWLDAAKEAKQQPLVKPWDEMNAIVSKYRNDLLDQKISSKDAASGIAREVNTLLASS